MAKQTEKFCDNVVRNHLHLQGWLPPGTTKENWEKVTIDQLQLDDPPLPSDPHFQKKRLSLEFQAMFYSVGSKLKSPLQELKTPAKTLRDLSDWFFSNHS